MMQIRANTAIKTAILYERVTDSFMLVVVPCQDDCVSTSNSIQQLYKHILMSLFNIYT